MLRPEFKVLGGGNYITLSANADVNSLEVGKWYFKGSGISLTNFSFSGAYLFWTSYNISGSPTTFKHQYAYSLTDSAVYHRNAWGEAWKDWSRVDAFGCETAADLASLLGVFPIVSYDESYFTNYTDKFIMNFVGANGATVVIGIPFTWGQSTQKSIQIKIDGSGIYWKQYNGNSWEAEVKL